MQSHDPFGRHDSERKTEEEVEGGERVTQFNSIRSIT